VQRWPDLYICIVYDRIPGDFSAKKNVYTPYILHVVLANPSCVCVNIDGSGFDAGARLAGL